MVDAVMSAVEQVPVRFQLMHNYPNPFNPETSIKFSVAQTGMTTLVVRNVLGQEVGELYHGIAEAGRYYTVRFSGRNLASGVYFYRLQSGTKVEIQKMLLTK
jgi:hypothetical protein